MASAVDIMDECHLSNKAPINRPLAPKQKYFGYFFNCSCIITGYSECP